jgi:uncharacterized protein with NRDE domain
VCVLAIWLAIDPETPLLVGANRDELRTRPSAPPGEIGDGIVAGRDLVSGGTWLGYTRDRLFVAITNRRLPLPTSASTSRGQLTLDALRSGTLQGVEDAAARSVERSHMAGFNLVAISGAEGICLHFDGVLRPVKFGPGIHVVSSDVDLDDPAMPEKRVLNEFMVRNPGLPSANALTEFLASHEGPRPICKHGDRFGTVSSTILSFGTDGARMLYADGRPCVTDYTDVADYRED